MKEYGVLQADASGAFGTGPISLEGEASVRTVKLNAANGVFGNSITLCTKMTSVSYPAEISLSAKERSFPQLPM